MVGRGDHPRPTSVMAISMAGTEGLGSVRPGVVGRGSAGMARHATVRQVWSVAVRTAVARRGVASSGLAGKARSVSVGQGKVRCAAAGRVWFEMVWGDPDWQVWQGGV